MGDLGNALIAAKMVGGSGGSSETDSGLGFFTECDDCTIFSGSVSGVLSDTITLASWDVTFLPALAFHQSYVTLTLDNTSYTLPYNEYTAGFYDSASGYGVTLDSGDWLLYGPETTSATYSVTAILTPVLYAPSAALRDYIPAFTDLGFDEDNYVALHFRGDPPTQAVTKVCGLVRYRTFAGDSYHYGLQKFVHTSFSLTSYALIIPTRLISAGSAVTLSLPHSGGAGGWSLTTTIDGATTAKDVAVTFTPGVGNNGGITILASQA